MTVKGAAICEKCELPSGLENDTGFWPDIPTQEMKAVWAANVLPNYKTVMKNCLTDLGSKSTEC